MKVVSFFLFGILSISSLFSTDRPLFEALQSQIIEAENMFIQKNYNESQYLYADLVDVIVSHQLEDSLEFFPIICGSIMSDVLSDNLSWLSYKLYLLNELIKKYQIDVEHFLQDHICSNVSEFQYEFQLCGCEATKTPKSIDECKESCASFAVAAAWACGKVSNGIVQLGCYGAVEMLRRKCVRCCETGNFFESCLLPLLKLFRDPYHPDLEGPDDYP